MLRRLPIRLKLALLAGVPVLGALMLAALISRDAQRNAKTAAALGSIEDLARLSGYMSKLVHELQFERSELSLRMGLKSPGAPELARRFAASDDASRALNSFLAARDLATLPRRLTRDLKEAQDRLQQLRSERASVLEGKRDFSEWLPRYEATDSSLISAIAALAQLSNDGEMMRAISALVSTMEIKERSSQEHALLSYVYAVNEFPPGTFKHFVTLTTEEADYVRVLQVNARDDVTRRFREIWEGPLEARSLAMRKVALEAVEDDFQVNPVEWHTVQGQKIEQLRHLEIELNEALRHAALAKVAAAQDALRVSYSLGASVIVVSAVLAGWIAVGVSRSIGSLARAAERVRRDQDFTVRAVKTSDDELGRLTDAFNDMLAGIQVRDDELSEHRGNLERLVNERTEELSQRNRAMRVVLDNVEQGLATIRLDGTLSPERSRAFDAWFGLGNELETVAERLGGRDDALSAWLRRGWEQVADGDFPPEVALDQMPRRMQLGERHYQLGYKAILDHERLSGALLIVSDITNEMQRLARDAEQREVIRTFEHLMRDRAGTVEFFEECESLVAHAQSGENRDRQSVLRALHTLKGNTLTYGVTSVADAAHSLETQILQGTGLPTAPELEELASKWRAFAARMRRLLGTEGAPLLELELSELDALMSAARRGVSSDELSTMLARLKLERAAVRLRRLSEQARSLAQRIGKASLHVEVKAEGDVRFERQRWAPFWAAFTHPLRNALDHGIEPEAERLAAGKQAHGTLSLGVRLEGRSVVVELADDGRGIDLAKVRAKAAELGLPHETEAQLLEALFHEGFSTSDRATELSGRGMGMSALREAARALGGVVSLQTRAGQGTTLRVRFPAT